MTNDRHDAPGTHRSHAAGRDAWPLTLALPDGRRADLVPGSRPAKYTIDGQPCGISVELPDDLAGVWFWHGSALAYDDRLWISTATYGPPGAANERGDCFTAARQFEMKRAEVRAIVAARPAKKVRRKKPAPVVAQPVQMELFAA